MRSPGQDPAADAASGPDRPRGRPKAPPLPDGSRNCNPPGISFWALVREGLAAHDGDLSAQGFWALFWHRFGNWRMGLPRLLRIPATAIYRIMFKATEIFCGIKLSYNVQVGRRVRIDHFGGIIIGARSVGDDVTIRQNTTMGIAGASDLNAKPMIGDRVTVGAGAVILVHVRVGEDSIVGANAVVVRDVPPGHLALGVPARFRPREVEGGQPG